MRLLLLALLLPLASFASDDKPRKEGVTTLHFTETARQSAEQDRIKATLRIEHDAQTPRAVQQFINDKMKLAIAKADRVGDIKAETLNYNVYQQHRWPKGDESRKRITYWQGQQTLELDSKDATKLLELAGDLQDLGFSMNGLNFYLSRAKAEGYRDQLITQALGQIKYRAKLIGQTLGMRNVAFTDITFSGAEPGPRPPMMIRGMAMAEMASDMAAPTARGGETDVSITIHATVELSK